MNYEDEKITDEVITEVYDLILSNAEQIAEKMFSPQGYWFYMQKDSEGVVSFSSMLTTSTRLNPVNFEKDEWVFRIDCNDDLDDVPVGEEIEMYYELITNEWSEEDIEQKISFPAK